jgi:hypothetical protein
LAGHFQQTPVTGLLVQAIHFQRPRGAVVDAVQALTLAVIPAKLPARPGGGRNFRRYDHAAEAPGAARRGDQHPVDAKSAQAGHKSDALVVNSVDSYLPKVVKFILPVTPFFHSLDIPFICLTATPKQACQSRLKIYPIFASSATWF